VKTEEDLVARCVAGSVESSSSSAHHANSSFVTTTEEFTPDILHVVMSRSLLASENHHRDHNST